MCQLSSYIWDTTDFINKLRRFLLAVLVTLDISLYTNIPHEEGITACEELLNCREIQVPPTADFCLKTWQRTHPFKTKKQIINKSMALPWNTNGAIIHQFVHGKAWMKVPADPGQNFLSLVKICSQNLCHLGLWWAILTILHWTPQSSPTHHQIYSFAVNLRSYLPRYEGLPEGWHDRYWPAIKPTDTHQYLRMESCHYELLLGWICLEEDHLYKWTQEF